MGKARGPYIEASPVRVTHKDGSVEEQPALTSEEWEQLPVSNREVGLTRPLTQAPPAPSGTPGPARQIGKRDTRPDWERPVKVHHKQAPTSK